MRCKQRIEIYLHEHEIHFEVQTHPLAYTAQDVAASERVPGRMVAKVVMVTADGRMVMLAVPAHERVNLSEVAHLLGASDVRMAEEREFAPFFQDCEVGAMPPFGNLYGLEVCVDRTLAEQPTIYFNAGSHTETISIAYDDYARLVNPILGSFSGDRVFHYA
jgi:Ala-tRNA(Pro) deacylase